MKEYSPYVIQVEGTGKTKNEAFIHGISKLQKEISKKTDGIIIRIEPLNIEVVSAKCYKKTEKFMFFFWKRDIETYQLILKVSVQLLIMETKNIEFQVIEKEDFDFRLNPDIRQ